MDRSAWFARSRVVLCAVAAAVAASGACRRPLDAADFTPIGSTFDAGDEGWTLRGDADGPFHDATGGNPGGFIRGVDRAEGESWYFVAPPRFLGDVRGAYGGALMFDMRQNRSDTGNYRDDDVVLVGGGITLQYDFPSDPRTNWTFFETRLSETGWVNAATRAAATRQEMETVLSSLSELRIRGEFFRGDDQADLDNVTFGAPR